jgi:hypothetical protein
MFRNALAFIWLALSVSPCLAQSLRNEGEYSRTDAAPETDNSPSMRTRPRSASMPEWRISIARLRVPGKARKLYQAALKAFFKRKKAIRSRAAGLRRCAPLPTTQVPLLQLAKGHALAGLKTFPQAVRELENHLHSRPSGQNAKQARDLLSQIQTVMSQ